MSATTPQAIADATGTDESAVAQAASIKSVYVYEAPVRLWHWVNALAIVVLAFTGYFIGQPLPTQPGEASANYLMGYIRFAHFAAGYVFAVGLLGAHVLGLRRQPPCPRAVHPAGVPAAPTGARCWR